MPYRSASHIRLLLHRPLLTQAQMLEIVANLVVNETHIGLVGMQQNGVEFV